LTKKIAALAAALDIDTTLSGNGVSKKDFDAALAEITELAYDDQTTPANPRQPRLEELRQLFIDQF
jgi:acetaldehyde dehydrogenase/alcohol dehydrogenase